MKCQKCGAEINATDKFCSSCGEKVTQVESTQSVQENQPPQARQLVKCENCGKYTFSDSKKCENCGAEIKAPVEKQELNKGLIAAFLAVIAFLLLMFFILTQLQNCNNDDQKRTEAAIEKYHYTIKPTEKVIVKPTEKPTEKKTEAQTEKVTEKPTEPPTEKATEPLTEKFIEIATDEATPIINNETSANGFWAEGSGDYIAAGLKVTGGYAVLHVENYSDNHFSVVSYKDGEYDDLLVNTSDPYSGDVLIDSSGDFELEISSKGEWKISSRGLDIDDSTYFSGHGDAVTGITTYGGGNWKITNDSIRHFSVVEHSLTKGYLDLLVNASGDPYSGIVKAEKGNDIFFEVKSEGNWSIEKQ